MLRNICSGEERISLERQSGNSLENHIVYGVLISIMESMAMWADPKPVAQRECVIFEAACAELCGREEPIDLKECAVLLLQLIFDFADEFTPANGRYGFGKTMVLHHSLDIEIFANENITAVCNLSTQLVLEVFPLVSDFQVLFTHLFLCFQPVFRAGVCCLIVLLS